MNTYKKRLIWWLALAAALVLFLLIGQTFYFRYLDHDQRRIESFYMEEPDSLDVVFLGASEFFADISCAQAYEEFGFTSYPFCTQANPVTLWKYEMQDIIEKQHPQLIVIETNGALYNSRRIHGEAYIRRVADNMPESDAKKAIIQAFGHDESISYEFPFLKYHTKWEHPADLFREAPNTLAMYLRGGSYLKGAYSNTGDVPSAPLIDVSGDNSSQPLDKSAEKYLKDFLDYCKTVDTPVIFTRFPHRISEAKEDYLRYQRTNALGEIIRNAGFEFINLDHSMDEIGIDPERDFYNNEHLNARGMRKMTSWFGEYLMDHYHITPKVQTEKNKQAWERSAAYMDAYYDYFETVKAKHDGEDRDVEESAFVMHALKKMLSQQGRQ